MKKEQNLQTEETQALNIPVVSGSAWVAETMVCGNCKHFKLDVGANVMGICSKKLMAVLSNMFINYKKEEGACFE